MAIVFLARDLKHDRLVAVKVLDPDLAASIGGERFLREIQVTAKLSHPHILPLYDSGEAGGFLYYVMPFVQGESLAALIAREKQLSLRDAVQIAREVAEALPHAHSYGLVHRDIKPDNIMMSGGHAIVADFGIATAVSHAGAEKLTQTGMTVGTPAYMSPEQGMGAEQLDDVILRAMAKLPAARYRTALEMAEALAEVDLAAPVARRPSRAVLAAAARPRRGRPAVRP